MRISLSDVSLQQAPVDILVVGVRSTNPKKDALLDKVEKTALSEVVWWVRNRAGLVSER